MPVPDEIDVYYDERKPPIRCHSVTEVDAALDKLHREADPTRDPLAVAIKVFGHEIDTGLGTDPTFLCLQIEPCDGEYYLAVGDQTDGKTRMFYGAGQDSYWKPINLIPLEAARSAVRYFIEHQKRSPSLRWHDWNGIVTTSEEE
jgi:Immunity protein Imm1